MSAVLGLHVGVLGRRPWRIDLYGEYWTPSSTASPGNADVGVTVQGGSAGLRGCGIPRWGRLELPLCGGLGAGALRGRGTGDLQIRRVIGRQPTPSDKYCRERSERALKRLKILLNAASP